MAVSLLEKAAFMLPDACSSGRRRPTRWLPVAAFGPLLGFGLSSLALLGRGPRARATAGRSSSRRAGPRCCRWRCWPGGKTAFGHSRTTVRGDAAAGGDRARRALVAACSRASARCRRAAASSRGFHRADYVWRRAVAELAKGDMPPVNPELYEGDDLHYYWLPHLSTAVSYRDIDRNLDGSAARWGT
ncbi:MAG: hypothetical protein R2712_29385 [Vicinamibacterales bacterium]